MKKKKYQIYTKKSDKKIREDLYDQDYAHKLNAEDSLLA
jgi:hypothetical protein